MKSERIKIKLVGTNDGITPEVEQKIWNEVLDLIFRKSISKQDSPAVDQGGQGLKGQEIKN